MMKHPFIGSTLLELLIILVIVGLVVQFAVPQYRSFVEKAQAKERLADLLSLQATLETCYLSNLDYRPCAEKLQEPSSGRLDKEAERFTYRLRLEAKDSEVICAAVETNHEHQLLECI